MQTKQSTKDSLRFQVKSNLSKRKVLLYGSLLAVLILITPYLFTLYQGFPRQKTLETFLGLYISGYYENVYVAAWTLWGKLIPLYLLIIWFFTCRHWWYHVILVPIVMYLKQIIDVLNDDLVFADRSDIYVLAPVVFIMAIFLYTIRTRVFDKLHGIDYTELSRGNWKGDIKVEDDQDNDIDIEDEDDEDDEPLFMGY